MGIGMKLLFELVPEAMLVFPKIPSSSWYCLKIGSSAELRPVCGSVKGRPNPSMGQVLK